MTSICLAIQSSVQSHSSKDYDLKNPYVEILHISKHLLHFISRLLSCLLPEKSLNSNSPTPSPDQLIGILLYNLCGNAVIFPQQNKYKNRIPLNLVIRHHAIIRDKLISRVSFIVLSREPFIMVSTELLHQCGFIKIKTIVLQVQNLAFYFL